MNNWSSEPYIPGVPRTVPYNTPSNRPPMSFDYTQGYQNMQDQKDLIGGFNSSQGIAGISSLFEANERANNH